MKSRFASVFVVLGLVACGGSADGPGKTPAETGDGPTPTPTAMRPEVAPEKLAGIRAREEPRSARALAEVERRFASRTPGLSFRVRRVDTNAMGDTHVWIQQVFQGTPVVGRDLGVIVFVDDTLRVLGEPDTFERVPPPRLTATAGLKRARDHVARKGLTVDDVGEVVLEPVYERRLRPGASGENAADYETMVEFERGTRVEVTSAFAPDEPRELFVRERDGAVLERGFPPSSGMVKAALYSRFAGNVALPTYQDSRGIYLLQSERYDFVSAATQPNGPPAFDYQNKTNSWGDGLLYSFQGPNTVNGQTAAVDAFISIYGTNRMFSDVYGRNGWNRQGGPIHAYVHAPETKAYPLGNGVIVLGYQPDSSGGFSGITLTDIETVAHEVGHMVFKEMTGVTTGPTGEMGGLNEGTADIFGLVAGFYLPDALAAATPCTSLTCGGGGLKPIRVRRDWIWGNWADPRNGRSFIDPHQFPEWKSCIVTADSHYAAGPLARMFYFLSVGVLPVGKAPFAGLLNPQRGSGYLPKGLTGLGIDATNWIWYHTLSGVYFSRVNNYLTAREMMLEATMGIYQRKPHTPEYKAVEDAWAAVNVGPPADRKPPTVSVTTEQKSRTEAIITVDVSDENGLVDGTVFIASGLIDGPTNLQPCTGHCVFTINPIQYGSHTSHYVEVTAKDTRENEVSRRVYFALDIHPPIKTLTSNKPANWPSIAPQQDFKFGGTDNMGITQAKLLVDGVAVVDQSWSTAPVPSFTIPNVVIDISNKPNGRYPLRVEVHDRFSMTWSQTALVVDRAPPDLCTLTATADPANNGKVHLTLTARDDLSGLSLVEIVRVGKGVVSSNTTPTGGGGVRTHSHLDTVPSTGQYTYYARCVDTYSNSGLSPSVPLYVQVMCNTMAIAGGAQVDERIFDMGKPSGTVTLSFHTFGVHDHIKVYSGSLLMAATGCASTGDPSTVRTMTFSYQSPSSQLRVRVEPNCDPNTAASTTQWNYSLSCP